MRRVLIIGGTRNLGPSIVQRFLEVGDAVTVLNRGVTADDLPEGVERLRADRADIAQMQTALGDRDFDIVVDTTLYNPADTKSTVELLNGRVGRYIFISTGQVYLIRTGLKRPYRESDYEGPLMPEPPRERAFDHDNWLYGFDKRGAEDVLFDAHAKTRFPFVTLRLPMVNSERDHFERIQGYAARLLDGGPILLPEGDHLALRHIYGEDVAAAIVSAASKPDVTGEAFNISQDEAITIDQFLSEVAACLETEARVMRVPYAELERRGVYPDCSPFSEPWMSELDNKKSVGGLGMKYTPYSEYLPKIFDAYCQNRKLPAGYARRSVELEIAKQFAAADSPR